MKLSTRVAVKFSPDKVKGQDNLGRGEKTLPDWAPTPAVPEPPPDQLSMAMDLYSVFLSQSP